MKAIKLKNPLKPCPFCGNSAILEQYMFDSLVRCVGCGATISVTYTDAGTKKTDNLVKMWNTRVKEK